MTAELTLDKDTIHMFETAISNLNIELQKVKSELVKKKKSEK